MNSTHDPRHIVDSLFVFMLFALFATCSVLLIAFGANIYEKTVANFDEHYNLTTSAAYVQEKFRQCDTADSCVVIPYGDCSALRISSYINETEYYTYIYKDDGYLKEMNTKADNKLMPKAGQRLLPITDLSVDDLGNGKFVISIKDDKASEITFTCTSKCDY
ncbi:MAG: DUF4860 domain-containing protein [Lachnospiraceae bacterium]|nr:DUF4860 domain-containing protein [Lachnospiraceae bacterium]